MHPDKIADRIAGAIVDLAYEVEENPKIAVEVLIGHGNCHIIAETSVEFDADMVCKTIDAAHRISNGTCGEVNLKVVKQDVHLADNQNEGLRCGDNGIFQGVPLTSEQRHLSRVARKIYSHYKYDGKYILDRYGKGLIICQSNARTEDLKNMYPRAIINPLGYWTGGTHVDTGATNRKLGSDMADSVTGGGLHGKDLSKADVSVNIYAFLKAQKTGQTVKLCCAIGDDKVDDIPYSAIVEVARNYIKECGGFEKFAEWGLY